MKRKLEEMGYPVGTTVEAAIRKASKEHQEACAKEKAYMQNSMKKSLKQQETLETEMEHSRKQALAASKEMKTRLERA